jgi:hypothetical protein
LPRLKEETRDKRLANLRFGPGHGRRRGSVNKANRDLKNGLLTAAINLGRDGQGTGGLVGYCEFLGALHPKAFSQLLGKLLPFNVSAEVNSNYIASVNVISVPADHYLSSQDIDRLRNSQPLEHVSTMKQITHTEPAPAPEIEVQSPEVSPEEEARIIDRLKAEIRELSQRMGVPCPLTAD